MAISRASILKELLPGLNGLFGLEYKQYEDEHVAIYGASESSERSFEEEQKLSGFKAAPVKDEGSPMNFDEAQEAYTARWTHETIVNGFSITEEAMEDNLYESLSARYTKCLARSMAYTKQVKAVFPLINGFSSTFQTGDNVNLFSTAHILVNGGTNANKPTTDLDLNETALEDAVINIAKFTDDRGLLIAARPIRLIIPPATQFVATRVLETQLRVATADNDINALRTNGAIPDGYSVNHYLTDSDAWFLVTDVPDGFKWFQRTALATSMDPDFSTGNARYRARERYSFSIGDHLGVYGSSGAT